MLLMHNLSVGMYKRNTEALFLIAEGLKVTFLHSSSSTSCTLLDKGQYNTFTPVNFVTTNDSCFNLRKVKFHCLVHS